MAEQWRVERFTKEQIAKLVDDVLMVATLLWYSDIILGSNKKISFSTNNWIQSLYSEFIREELEEKKDETLDWHYKSIENLLWETPVINKKEAKIILDILCKSSKDVIWNFVKVWSADFSYTIESDLAEYWLFSYRVNATKNRAWLWFVIRVLPDKEMDYKDVWIPFDLVNLTQKTKQWLIIITWPTGSWKTTTLVSLMSFVNTHLNKNVITIEDPVEFIYPESWKSMFTQREVWADTESFELWLKDALRMAPNIIVIWELRSAEVIKIANEAALTWHLVLATFHAWSAVDTLEWIIERSWSPEIKHALASSLVAICAQKMVKYQDIKTKKFKRQIAVEYLTKSVAVESLLKWPKESLKQINSELLKTPNKSLEDSLFDMVFEWKICYTEAFDNMRNKVKKEEDFIEKLTNYVRNKRLKKEVIEVAIKLEELREWKNSRFIFKI